jgi:septum formation protein
MTGQTERPLLILASQSPGRAQVLRQAGIAFRQIVSQVDEDAVAAAAGPLGPAQLASALARAKAHAVAQRPEASESLVLGCDSVFELDGAVFGKPHTTERATERLRAQSGRTGVLHSGLCVIDTRQGHTAGVVTDAVTSTRVTFAPMSDDDIAAYVETGEPLECAGSFTIDGRGAAFIERIEGDPAAVIGISVQDLRRQLEEHGIGIREVWRC